MKRQTVDCNKDELKSGVLVQPSLADYQIRVLLTYSSSAAGRRRCAEGIEVSAKGMGTSLHGLEYVTRALHCEEKWTKDKEISRDI